jgi:hypothetical protein
MPADLWQDALIDELRAILEPDEDVRALVVFGSWAAPDLRDRFSDVDFWLVTVKGCYARFFPSIDWVAPIGEVFAVERSTRERHGALRICLDDMRRFDVVVVEEPVVEDIENWAGHPLRGPRMTVFSRSAAVDRAVEYVDGVLPIKGLTPREFAAKVDDFWFVAQLVVHKSVRGDLLVAAHLAFGLQRHCLELAMTLRDRDTGTRHPRGAAGDAAVLARLPLHRGYSAGAIIDAVEQACTLFDDLATKWDPTYAPKMPLLTPMIAEARKAL